MPRPHLLRLAYRPSQWPGGQTITSCLRTISNVRLPQGGWERGEGDTYNKTELMAARAESHLEEKLERLDMQRGAGEGFEVLDGGPVADGAEGVVLVELVVQPVGGAA